MFVYFIISGPLWI